MLNLSNVEVIYDKVFLAIRGVSLSVDEGSMVALLGRTARARARP